MNRRRFTKTSAIAVAGFAFPFTMSGAVVRAGQTPDDRNWLGGSEEAFRNYFGEGGIIDEAGNLWAFGNPDYDGLPVYARFSDGITTYIELSFGGLESGGLAVSDAQIEMGRIHPSDVEGDVTFEEVYLLPPPNAAQTLYRFSRNTSESLAMSFIDCSQSRQLSGERLYHTLSATLPASDAAEAGTRHPDAVGIGSSQADWEALYGEGQVAQSGFVYDDVQGDDQSQVTVRYTPDTDLVSFVGIDGGEDSVGTPESAFARIHSQLTPVDAEYQGVYLMPATPGGPVGFTLHRWQSASSASLGGGKGSILGLLSSVEAEPDDLASFRIPRVDVFVDIDPFSE